MSQSCWYRGTRTTQIRGDKFHGGWNYEILPRNLSFDQVLSSQLLIQTFGAVARNESAADRVFIDDREHPIREQNINQRESAAP
jgi:hypothetical protein